MSDKTLGQVAYEAWSSARGRPWEDIGAFAQGEWERTAAAVLAAARPPAPAGPHLRIRLRGGDVLTVGPWPEGHDMVLLMEGMTQVLAERKVARLTPPGKSPVLVVCSEVVCVEVG